MSYLLEGLKRENPLQFKRADEGKPELSMVELLSGMANQEFFFHHQPIYDLVTENQIGSEMLIRWTRHGEVLAPMWFMPMIERHGLIKELDYYVVNKYKEIPWVETVKPDFCFRVFINISAQSFIDPDFVHLVSHTAQIMREQNVVPVLEISERTGCEIGLIKSQMEDLHNNGIQIALDDFGIGFSSLSRLIELPVDILKIDRSIIRMIGNSTHAETVTRHIFHIAKELNIKVIAEGVETEIQSNWLLEFSQCWVQGFYFARPTLNGYAQKSPRFQKPVCLNTLGEC